MPQLPPGFVLEQQRQSSPQVPQGFVLEQPAQQPTQAATAEQPGMLRQAAEGARDFADQFVSQGALVGFGDEAFAAVNTPAEMAYRAYTGEDAGKGIGERISSAYGAGVESARGQDRAAQERSPIASTAGEIGGALATGAGAARAGASLIPRVAKAGLPAKMGAGAVEGAAWGGAHGLGRGEGGDRIASGFRGAGTGLVTGGMIPAAASGIGAAGRKVMERQARKAIPGTDEITKQANKLYETAKKSGVTLKPETSTRLADELKSTLDEAAFHPRIHPKVAAAYDEIVSDAGKPLTLERVDQLRRIAGSAAKSNEADERRVASMMIEKLDEVVDDLSSADVTGSGPATATALLKQARGLWSRKRKDEIIADAVERAVRRAESTGSGGNVDNAIRQNIRSILDNPKKRRGFSKGERALMEHIVKGGKGQNLMRLIGKLSPSGNGLMAALGLGATVANPLMAAGPVAGMVAKSAADRITPRNVSRLSDTIRAGGQLPQGKQLTPQQQELLRSMMTGSIQQGHRAEPVLSPVLPFGGQR